MIEKSVRANGRTRVRTMFGDDSPSLTQQQFKKECDVNEIVMKFRRTGTITHVRNAAAGVYADMSSIPSYQDALNTIIKANEAFAEVPADIRNRFAHDPQKFIDFLADPKNDDEAVKLGLKVRPDPVKPDPILSELQTLNKNLSKPKGPKKPPSEE